jgi:general secretion pathway protein D
VAGTNKEEVLRQALRQTLDGLTNNSSTPSHLLASAGAADAPGSVQPGSASVAGDAAASPTNRIVQPANPPVTNPPVTRLVIPNNPVPASDATVPNPGPAPGPTATIPNPAPAAPGAVPGAPGSVPASATPGSTDSAGAAPEDIIPAGVINFAAVDIQEVLKIYAELVNRTILRPTALPATVITLRTQTALTKKEAIQALDAVLALNGVSVIPVGEKFVKVVGSPQANQVGAAFSKQDVKDLPELGSYVTHVVQVTNVKPSELVTVLQPFASQIPNPILAIDGSQMLVLRDYSENVKRELELIAKIDVAVPAEYISEVIPIKYALASEISAALNSLSAGGGGTTVGQAPGGTGGGGLGAGGARRSSFGTQRSLGVGGVGGAGYQNPYGTPGQFGQQGVQGNVGGVGGSTGAGGGFTDRLRSIIQRASTSGEIQVIGQTKIIADERTNSLLIFASRTDMEVIKKIISQLDVVLAQVLIETVIIEVTLGPDTKNFGFSYIQPPRLLGNKSLEGAGGAGQFLSPGFTALGAATNAGSGGLTGGFNYLAQFGNDLDVTITALEANSKAKVLQRPRIQTSHAVQATIFVGESRPYPQGSYYGGGSFGGYSTIQQLQIGVTLDVTPLINPDGLVVMDIHQTIENYAGFTDITGVGQVPITTRKEAAAKVAVRDRDTIMLGGLIETDKSKSGSGVPFLMDIPLLGYLFRSSSSSETRKELIVLIRPTVLPTPEVAALTAKAEKERMPGVRQAEREIQDEEAARLKQSEKLFKTH